MSIRVLDEITGAVTEPYTLLGDNGLKGCKKKFILHCANCSKDEELFPKGTFQITKGHFLKGLVPCNCSGKFIYKEWQQVIRVKRECDLRCYIFKGWAGDYKKSETRLQLYNPKTGNSWTTTSIAKFMFGRGDPVEGRIKTVTSKAKPLDVNLKEIKKAFKDDKRSLEFYPISAKKCKVICNDCKSSVFHYELSDVATYICETSNLLKGQLRCTCNPKYRMNVPETLLLCEINSQLSPTVFKEFHGRFKGVSDTEGIFSCKKCNFLFKRRMSNWLNLNYGCPLCTKNCNRNGWYPDRAREVDYLYIIQFEDGKYKLGRSFNTKQRFSKFPTINKIYLFKGMHEEVYNLEQKVLSLLGIRGTRLDLGFSKEGFKAKDLTFVLSSVKDASTLKEVYYD